VPEVYLDIDYNKDGVLLGVPGSRPASVELVKKKAEKLMTEAKSEYCLCLLGPMSNPCLLLSLHLSRPGKASGVRLSKGGGLWKSGSATAELISSVRPGRQPAPSQTGRRQL
jgi:hypothetical protein